MGLYQSQEKEVEAKIKGGMEFAHFMEMKKRIEWLRNDDKGPHRQLTGSVAFSMDEDDDIDQKVKVKKVRGGKVVQSVQTTFTKQEKRSEDDKTECIIENDNTFDTSGHNLSRNVKGQNNRSNNLLKSTFSKIEEEDYTDTIIQNMTSAVYDGLEELCASSNAKIAYKVITNDEFNEKLKETNTKIQ